MLSSANGSCKEEEVQITYLINHQLSYGGKKQKKYEQCNFFFIFSGSMEPAFFRGDLLFLTNYREEPIRVGEIVVFKIEGRDIPIVHRVLKVHEK